jgi:hypothetical protein
MVVVIVEVPSATEGVLDCCLFCIGAAADEANTVPLKKEAVTVAKFVVAGALAVASAAVLLLVASFAPEGVIVVIVVMAAVVCPRNPGKKK